MYFIEQWYGLKQSRLSSGHEIITTSVDGKNQYLLLRKKRNIMEMKALAKSKISQKPAEATTR